MLRNKGQRSQGEGSQQCGSELSQLMAAAVVSSTFRRLLLSNPEQALARGYAGRLFALTQDERRRVLAIRAASINDFAAQLLDDKPRAPRKALLSVGGASSDVWGQLDKDG